MATELKTCWWAVEPEECRLSSTGTVGADLTDREIPFWERHRPWTRLALLGSTWVVVAGKWWSELLLRRIRDRSGPVLVCGSSVLRIRDRSCRKRWRHRGLLSSVRLEELGGLFFLWVDGLFRGAIPRRRTRRFGSARETIGKPLRPPMKCSVRRAWSAGPCSRISMGMGTRSWCWPVSGGVPKSTLGSKGFRWIGLASGDSRA